MSCFLEYLVIYLFIVVDFFDFIVIFIEFIVLLTFLFVFLLLKSLMTMIINKTTSFLHFLYNLSFLLPLSQNFNNEKLHMAIVLDFSFNLPIFRFHYYFLGYSGFTNVYLSKMAFNKLKSNTFGMKKSSLAICNQFNIKLKNSLFFIRHICNLLIFLITIIFMIKRFTKLPKITKELNSNVDQLAQIQRSIELLSTCFANFTSSFRSIIAKKIDNEPLNQFKQMGEDSSSSCHDKDKILQSQQQAIPINTVQHTSQKSVIPGIKNNSQLDNQQQLQKEIQPRFKEVNVPPPTINSNSNFENELVRHLIDWLGQVCKLVFSTGFNLFEKGVLSESKIKSFCSENFIRNILRFCQRYKLQPKHFLLINKTLEKQILPYFLLKYPQSQEKQSSKKFSSVLIEKDDTTQNDIDLVYKSGVTFKMSESGNYSSQIMLFFNWIMRLPNLQLDKSETLYESFQKDVGSLFKMVENEKEMMDMLKFDPKNPKITKQIELEIVKKYLQTEKEVKDSNEISVKKNHQQEKAEFEYRQKVKSYTHYLIGAKLSTNLDIFSEFDIKSANLRFKNSALMRVATKFCEQLEKWFNPRQISNRQSFFRMKDGSQKFLNNEDKTMLNLFLKLEKRYIDEKLDNIIKNNSQHQSFFARNCNESELSKFCEGEAIVGKFTSIIYKLGESYLIYYLNLLLHGINRAANNYGSVKDYKNSTQFKQKQNESQLHRMFEEHNQNQIGEQWLNKVYKEIGIKQRSPQNAAEETPQLINFKIGDLMRCKCVSKQNEILAIYKQVERISHTTPSLFKIIRVKNRLNQGNKDILMNLIYKQKMVVEMQLTIKSEKSNFIECSNKFNHYLYELKRAKFGPLTEMCCIWVNQDLRSPFYAERLKENTASKKLSEKENKPCCQQSDNQQMRDLPFLCSQCQSFYYDCSTSQKHTLCLQCKRITCFWCNMNKKDEKQELISELVESNPGLEIQSAEFSKAVPSNSGVLVNLKSNSKDISFFNTIEHNGYYYLFQALKSQSKNSQIPRLNLLYKFKNKNNEFHSDFLKDTLVLSSKKMTKKIIGLQKYQANLFVFIPEYLAKRYQTRSKSVFLSEKKIKDNYFSELMKSYPQLSQKAWSSVERLNLASNKLQSVDQVVPEMFPNIQYLILNNNSLKTIGCEKTVFHWKNLKYLNLSNNEIQQTDKIVNNFPNLILLDLSVNCIKKLSQNFGSLKSLVYLNVSSNAVTELGSQLGQLLNLEVFKARRNKIKSISIDFCKLKKLRIIELERNHLNQIPVQFSELKSLQKLELNFNHIQKFPDIFNKFKELQNLQLERLKMKQFPSTITSLQKLKVLNINFCTTLHIPADIGSLSALKQFQISYVKITELPPNFTKLTNLLKLNLIETNIKALPEAFGELINLSIINFKQSTIQTLPQSIQHLKNLTKISFQRCKQLKQLPQSFGKLSSLSELVLAYSGITKLPQSFGNLKHLTKLQLAFSQISDLSQNFGNLASLIQLNLMGTPLLTLPASFGNLKSLVILNLYKSKIQILPQSFGKIRTLKQLTMYSTPLKNLPVSFGGLRLLSDLNISASNLQSLPESFGTLISLTSLELFETKMKCLPKYFENLKSLIRLDLSCCQIESLPQLFGNMESLEDLELPNTLLTTLPQNFGKLKCLKMLNLSQSAIQHLSQSFCQLIAIESINLNYTPITSLPSSFGKLVSLTKLCLQETKIISLPDSFGNLVNLNQLYLNQTPIISLPYNFGGMRSLQILKLQKSKIECLPQSFGNLISLSKLDLEQTPITRLPQSFGNLKQLGSLNLTESLIKTLPQSFGKLKKLYYLLLGKSKIESMPESIGNIQSLSKLDLTQTKNLKTLPQSFGKLKLLRNFYITDSGIEYLPNSFGNAITQIQNLDFTNTKLVSLSSSFGPSLKSLNVLILTNCPIQILPQSFGKLSSLTTLSMNKTCIKQLPQSFGQLSSLVLLDLDESQQLQTLPQSFGSLKSLKFLKISGKSFKRLPNSIDQLQKLERLQISKTRVTVLPQQMGDLSTLKYLQISKSPLEKLPSSLCNLKQLTKLNLNMTSLQLLPQNFGNIQNLLYLNLCETKLKTLPESIIKLEKLLTIQLSNNQYLQRNVLITLVKLAAISHIKFPIWDTSSEEFPPTQLFEIIKPKKSLSIDLQCKIESQYEKIKNRVEGKGVAIRVKLVNQKPV